MKISYDIPSIVSEVLSIKRTPYMCCISRIIIIKNRTQFMQLANRRLVSIIQLLNDRKIAEEIIEHGQTTYKLHKNQLKHITTSFILDYFQKQQKQATDINLEKPIPMLVKQQYWHPNQLKIFTWVLLSYGFLQHKSLLQFNEEDLLSICEMFPKKTLNFVRYHHLHLIKSAAKQSRCEWSKDEVIMLTDIIQSHQFERKWSDIAYELYCRSGLASFKTSHQCREKWFNHLNPALSKEKWTIEEDIALFKNARDIGTKWAKISKAMGEYRTQHMIKNRFKSIAKKYENRYQRCTMRKRIENILKDLELKRTIKEKQVQEKNQDEIKVEESVENAMKAEESVQNTDNSVKEMEVEVEVEANPITPATETEFPPKQPEPNASFNKIHTSSFQTVTFEYAEQKYDFVYDEGIIVNLRPNSGYSDIMLIDYFNMDFQARNKTIFSGSVE